MDQIKTTSSQSRKETSGSLRFLPCPVLSGQACSVLHVRSASIIGSCETQPRPLRLLHLPTCLLCPAQEAPARAHLRLSHPQDTSESRHCTGEGLRGSRTRPLPAHISLTFSGGWSPSRGTGRMWGIQTLLPPLFRGKGLLVPSKQEKQLGQELRALGFRFAKGWAVPGPVWALPGCMDEAAQG